MCDTRNGDGCGQIFLSCELTVDHIIPKTLGGNGDIVNKQLLCAICHFNKTEWYNVDIFGKNNSNADPLEFFSIKRVIDSTPTGARS